MAQGNTGAPPEPAVKYPNMRALMLATVSANTLGIALGYIMRDRPRRSFRMRDGSIVTFAGTEDQFQGYEDADGRMVITSLERRLNDGF